MSCSLYTCDTLALVKYMKIKLNTLTKQRTEVTNSKRVSALNQRKLETFGMLNKLDLNVGFPFLSAEFICLYD